MKACGEAHFLVRRNPWVAPYAAVAYEEIADLEGGVVHLRHGVEALVEPDQPDLRDGPLAAIRPIHT